MSCSHVRVREAERISAGQGPTSDVVQEETEIDEEWRGAIDESLAGRREPDIRPGVKIEDNGDAGWMGRHRRGRPGAAMGGRLNGYRTPAKKQRSRKAVPRGQKGTHLRGITLLPRRAGATEAAPRDVGAKGGVVKRRRNRAFSLGQKARVVARAYDYCR